MCVCVCTHRKQNHGDCQRDGHKNSNTNTQDQRVQRIHLTVGVEELSFGVLCSHTHTHTHLLKVKSCSGWRRGFLTIEGQVPKDGCEEVHGEHSQNGNIADVLHSSPSGTSGTKAEEIYPI